MFVCTVCLHLYIYIYVCMRVGVSVCVPDPLYTCCVLHSIENFVPVIVLDVTIIDCYEGVVLNQGSQRSLQK